MFGDGLDDVMQNGQACCSVYSLMVRDSPQRVNFSATSSDARLGFRSSSLALALLALWQCFENPVVTAESMILTSDDYREGATAFPEKRAPNFKGSCMDQRALRKSGGSSSGNKRCQRRVTPASAASSEIQL